MKSGWWWIALPAAVMTAGCGTRDKAAHEDVRPVKSSVAVVSSGRVGATYSGQVHARYESKLGFQTSGKVVARLVDVGAHVRRGQVLMRLDPAQQTLHVVTATADVDAARNRVAQNRTDLARTEQLQARSFASQAEVDRERLALAESEAQLKSALAQRDIKVNQRDYTVLVADRDGLVTAVGAEAGQVVSAGQAVVTVAGDGDREVLVSVPESRVDELRQGRAFAVSAWALPGKTYAGSLRELAPDTDSVTRTYSARFAVKNADRALLLGMTASVSAPHVGASTAIRLPLTSILYKDERPHVWIVDRATAQVSLREVRVGAGQNDAVLIDDGIREGEVVVTAGVHMLHAGQRVRAAGADGASAMPSLDLPLHPDDAGARDAKSAATHAPATAPVDAATARAVIGSLADAKEKRS